MKNKIYPSLLAGFVLATTAHSSLTDRLGKYDFAYAAVGELRVRPVQVFDDGQNTYFQFRPGDAIPAIFAVTPQGPLFASPSIEGPYVKVSLIAKAFHLRLGMHSGRVAHASFNVGDLQEAAPTRAVEQVVDAATSLTARAKAAQVVVASASGHSAMPTLAPQNAPARIDLQTNSYATPLAGDRVQWATTETHRSEDVLFPTGSAVLSKENHSNLKTLAVRLQEATRIDIEGFDDESYREGIAKERAEGVVRVLLASGIDRSKITYRISNAVATPVGTKRRLVAGVRIAFYTSRAVAVSAPTNVAPPASSANGFSGATRTWTLQPSDVTLDQALNRWARDAGWTLVNKGAPTVQVVGSTQLQMQEFIKAADTVITIARRAGYPIEAVAYANNILVISKRDKE